MLVLMEEERHRFLPPLRVRFRAFLRALAGPHGLASVNAIAFLGEAKDVSALLEGTQQSNKQNKQKKRSCGAWC